MFHLRRIVLGINLGKILLFQGIFPELFAWRVETKILRTMQIASIL
jgi:hypothetical protein